MRTTAYRADEEYPILFLTVLILGGIALLTAGATICLAPLLAIIALVIAYQVNQSNHKALINQAYRVSLDDLSTADSKRPFSTISLIARDCLRTLEPGEVELFIARGRERNAYTFGLSSPQIIVVYAPLVEIMDPDELKFVIGHEMGHVALGHSWLNTLVGGMAGIPQTYGTAIVLTAAFRWWNRACEYSADRAGLLACHNPARAISALVKLVAGDIDSPTEMKRALQLIEAEDDSWGNVLSEALSTHPMIVKRINQIRSYAASSAYQRLSARIKSG
jgi:Zn-dependent protease with chaperone function